MRNNDSNVLILHILQRNALKKKKKKLKWSLIFDMLKISGYVN